MNKRLEAWIDSMSELDDKLNNFQGVVAKEVKTGIDTGNKIQEGKLVEVTQKLDLICDVTNKVYDGLDSMGTQLQGIIEEEITVRKKDMEEFRTGVTALTKEVTVPAATYADKVKEVPAISVVKRAVRPVAPVVLVRPPLGVKDTKGDILKIVNPVADNIKIKNVRRLGQGGVAVETATSEDAAKVMAHMELKNKGFKAEIPGRRGPRVIVHDVDRALTEEQVMEAILRQNDFNEDDAAAFKTQFRLRFRDGRPREDLVDWVAEVSPDARTRLRKRERLYIGWTACRVQDFIAVSRCFKCQLYGHIAKYCRQSGMVCGHCGEDGHGIKECNRKDSPAICILCKRAKKEFSHAIVSKECQAYQYAVDRLVNRTDCGLSN